MKEQLPHFMIPSVFVQLDQFPLTPNGKVDRNALSLENESFILKKEYIAPSTETEQTLVEIWQEVLK